MCGSENTPIAFDPVAECEWTVHVKATGRMFATNLSQRHPVNKDDNERHVSSKRRQGSLRQAAKEEDCAPRT